MKKDRAAVVFFAALLLAGLWVYRDYGVSWDEPISRNNGIMAYRYAVLHDPAIFDYTDRQYGTAFELPLVLAERAFRLTDIRDIYLARHLFTFLFFFVSVFFFYLLLKFHFADRGIALAGCLFLVFSPRIFADAFYNSKDLVFMSAFIVAMYTLARYSDKKTVLNAFYHSAASAVLIDIRVLGVFVPLFTVFFEVLDWAKNRNDKRKILRDAGMLLVHVIFLLLLVVFLWPILWEEPLGYFLESISRMSHFPWKGTVLYFGGEVDASCVPWHYIPVWMGITTPPFFIFLFFLGLASSAVLLFWEKAKFFYGKRTEFSSLLWFFLPLGTVIAAKAVLYDGWRHMFFIYPAFLMIGIAALASLLGLFGKFSDTWKRSVLFIVVAAAVLPSAVFMARYHPHENVYFNFLVGKSMADVKKNFELDYWGLSYRKALEYILKNDPREKIKILAANDPGEYNAMLIPAKERIRLSYAKDPSEADYFITNFRWHPEEYPFADRKVYSVRIGDADIMAVYKLK